MLMDSKLAAFSELLLFIKLEFWNRLFSISYFNQMKLWVEGFYKDTAY